MKPIKIESGDLVHPTSHGLRTLEQFFARLDQLDTHSLHMNLAARHRAVLALLDHLIQELKLQTHVSIDQLYDTPHPPTPDPQLDPDTPNQEGGEPN